MFSASWHPTAEKCSELFMNRTVGVLSNDLFPEQRLPNWAMCWNHADDTGDHP